MVDPRTGEIIVSHVVLTSALIKEFRDVFVDDISTLYRDDERTTTTSSVEEDGSSEGLSMRRIDELAARLFLHATPDLTRQLKSWDSPTWMESIFNLSKNLSKRKKWNSFDEIFMSWDSMSLHGIWDLLGSKRRLASGNNTTQKALRRFVETGIKEGNVIICRNHIYRNNNYIFTYI